MSKYNVHLYPVNRVLLANIEADSHQQAIEIAEQRFFNGEYDEKEAAEEISGYLVDEIVPGNDENCEAIYSTWYEADGVTKADVALKRQEDIKEFIGMIARMSRYSYCGNDSMEEAPEVVNELIATARELNQ